MKQSTKTADVDIHRVTFVCPRKLLDAIDKVARREDRDRSWVIRRALTREVLDRERGGGGKGVKG